MTAVSLKTPINYYGGKVQLLPKLLPFIPEHGIYCEPFFGGGALFFAKKPAEIEFINDINKQVVNFYKVAKRQFAALKDEVDVTLYSEEQFLQARSIYFEKEQSDDVLRAWSLFLLSQQTFLHILDNAWAYSRTRNVARTFANKKEMFDERYVTRLENTQIFCRDGIKVILNADSPETFHFLDPPYVETDCGHYGGYKAEDLQRLLKTCEGIEGKFLMTHFPNKNVSEFATRNGWYQVEFSMHKPVSNAYKKDGERKIEVFTMNFTPSKEMLANLPK